MSDRPRPRVAPETGLAVWQAEDGRCEACGRPMDRRWARFTRVDHGRLDWSADNLHLLCIDCDKRRPDLLTRLVLAEDIVARMGHNVGPEQALQVSQLIRTLLRRHAVLVWASTKLRQYWLPGVASFKVAPRDDGTALVVAVEKLAPTPELRLKPQASTRGLPKPDRRPLTVAMRG